MESLVPKVSIIVPVYKAESYLHRCVDSLLAQTFLDYEILLIDDGSPDRSGVICDEYTEKDKRVCVFHKENGGVSSARNLGLDMAVGEFLLFIDSDDWIEKECIEHCMRCFEQNNVDLLQFELRIINLDGSIRYNRNIKDVKLSNIEYLENNNLNVCVGGNVFRRCLIEKHNLRFDEKMKLGEDQKFVLNYIEHCSKIQSISKPYYNYFQNTGSAMHNTKTEDLIYCAKKMADFKIVHPIIANHCDNLILSHICILIGRPGVLYNDIKSLYVLVNKDFSLMPTPLLIIAKFSFRLFYLLIKLGKIIRKSLIRRSV